MNVLLALWIIVSIISYPFTTVRVLKSMDYTARGIPNTPTDYILSATLGAIFAPFAWVAVILFLIGLGCEKFVKCFLEKLQVKM